MPEIRDFITGAAVKTLTPIGVELKRIFSQMLKERQRSPPISTLALASEFKKSLRAGSSPEVYKVGKAGDPEEFFRYLLTFLKGQDKTITEIIKETFEVVFFSLYHLDVLSLNVSILSRLYWLQALASNVANATHRPHTSLLLL